MPELPEVETIATQLRKQILGQTFQDLVFRQKAILKSSESEMLSKIPGSTIQAINRRGKYLCFVLSETCWLWLHLGMTGQLIWDKTNREDDNYIQVTFTFKAKSQKLFFRDVRTFGRFFLTAGDSNLPAGLENMGPEPLEVTEADFIRRFKSRTGRIKSLLLNQNVLAGIGNIYADESLHRAGVDPRKRAYRLTRQRLAALHAKIQETLTEAIQCGGTTIDDYLHTDWGKGQFQTRLRVYGRQGQPCPHCQTPVRRIVLAGRSASFCPKCQR